MSVAVLIPARYGSRRLPGKPLAELGGRPMVAWVHDAAKRATAGRADVRVAVATDDARIADCVAGFGGEAIMTPAECPSGSDRLLAAAEQLSPRPHCVLNVQGDMPLLPPPFIGVLLDALTAPSPDRPAVATCVTQLAWADLDELREHKAHQPFSGTTAVVRDGHALWFSKQILPAIRGEAKLREQTDVSPVRRHIGLYGYTLDALRRFVRWPPSTYESLEGLEQLRFVEHGVPIRCLEVDYGAFPAMSGVDAPEDLARAEALLPAYRRALEALR